MGLKFKLLAVSLLVLTIALLGTTTAVTTAPEARVYKMAMHDDLTTSNYINYLGPGATVWTAYVLGNMHPSLYGLTDVTFKPVLSLAEDYATPVKQEGGFWTSEVCITPGNMWSDGEEITAEDLAFSYNAILKLDPIALGGNWPYIIDPELLDHVDVTSKYCIKFFMKDKPGLSRWEYGLLGAPILPEHYWGPKVENALATADPAATILAETGIGEPSGTSFVFREWVEGSHATIDRSTTTAPAETEGMSRVLECASGFYGSGGVGPVAGGGYRASLYLVAGNKDEYEKIKVLEGPLRTIVDLEYFKPNDDNMAVMILTKTFGADRIATLWTFVNNGLDTVKNQIACDVTLDFNPGPYIDSVLYPIYGTMAAGALAVIAGEVHYHLNPLGYEKGLADQLRAAANVKVIENAPNGIFYLSFNLRRAPFNNIYFRKAIDCAIDREYVTKELLAGVAMPGYTPVPPGNAYWYKEPTPEQAQARCIGFSKADKVKRAVEYLKAGGFSWPAGQEPEVLPDGTIKPGKGIMLDGVPLKEIEFIHPNPAYDNKRNIFGLHVTKVANELGIPVRNVPTGFRVIVTRVFDQQDFDMWSLGWGLGIYPDYLQAFFHSRYTSPGDFNAQGYSNPEYDVIADAFVAEQDLGKAKELAYKLQDFLAEELPYVVLFYSTVVEAYRSDMVAYPYTTTLDGLQAQNGMPGYVKLLK